MAAGKGDSPGAGSNTLRSASDLDSPVPRKATILEALIRGKVNVIR